CFFFSVRFFFFSSRRRHTRCYRDWSSDVCSSDLSASKILFSEHHLSHAASAFFCSPFEEAAVLTVDGVGEWATASLGVGRYNERSEERRVGKECRSRG